MIEPPDGALVEPVRSVLVLTAAGRINTSDGDAEAAAQLVALADAYIAVVGRVAAAEEGLLPPSGEETSKDTAAPPTADAAANGGGP